MNTFVIVDGEKINTKDGSIEIICIEQDVQGRHIMIFKYHGNEKRSVIYKEYDR